MELWPENDSIARLNHTGITLLAILFITTLGLGKYLESFPPLLTLPITAKVHSVAYFFTCLLVILGLGIKFLSVEDKQESIKYGLGVCGFFIFAWLLWIGIKLVNIKADTSQPQKIDVIVFGKHTNVGKGGSSKFLDVFSVNNKTKKYRFRVTSSVYFNSKVKDKFNIWYKNGYFNDPWVLSYKNLENPV